MKRPVRRTIQIAAVLVGVAALVYAFMPRPTEVELVACVRAPMRVTVDEDGQTRIKERYTISAPLTGRLSRITLDPGAPVKAGETIVASIEPTDPELLDPRTLAQAQARVQAAQAALNQAEAALARASAANELAISTLKRQQEAYRNNALAASELDEAVAAAAIRAAEYRAAGFARDIASFELEQAKAALLHASPDHPGADWRFDIQAPVSGVVLRVFQESSAVVTPGTPLLEVGDPTDLEAAIDVLSTQAVAIRPGAPVIFERWGGDEPLHGTVRLVEPSAFTKISALGVEEQRVYVIVDFTSPPEARASLGDNFRVEARIVVWEDHDALTIPTSALFRAADDWCVFVVEDGRAKLRKVRIGRRNTLQAQVLEGLREGEQAVAYPSDKVREGSRVKPVGGRR
jgi:HlyD family secretion protein